MLRNCKRQSKKTLKSRLSGGFFYFWLGAVITSVSR